MSKSMIYGCNTVFLEKFSLSITYFLLYNTNQHTPDISIVTHFKEIYFKEGVQLLTVDIWFNVSIALKIYNP